MAWTLGVRKRGGSTDKVGVRGNDAGDLGHCNDGVDGRQGRGSGRLAGDDQTDAKLGVVLMGIYAYACFYSPGFGPVPFTYAAEAFPLYIREIGMTYSTVVLWFFNSVLAITWFRMEEVFKPQGAFGWYAAWCVILWILTFFLLPETKALTLEELDIVFSVPTKKHASYQFRQIPYYIKRNFLFQRGAKKEQLYTLEDSVSRA